jgi:hypothetical protein
MPVSIRKRLKNSTIKLWLAGGGLLGASMLPCPDCGTPMILHVWPLVGFVLIARAIKKRAQEKEMNPEPYSEDKNPK